ncbi:MAG: hypothetical protein JWR19_4593 [Pedosphaera sp.]|nr:hypothetical protein [Pedosphaera sp.]
MHCFEGRVQPFSNVFIRGIFEFVQYSNNWMHCRRLTRLTNAFSKKLENFEGAVALNFAYYNFCKMHGAIRCTPAMEAGIEQSQWTVAELVERCGE